MLKRFAYIIIAATLAGCSGTEPETPVIPIESLAVTVTDGGFDGRAAEEGLITTFVAGDRIGLFAVKDGKIFDNLDNVCLTAEMTAEGLHWLPAENTILPDLEGIVWFAYYPYCTSLPDDIRPEATESAESMFSYVTGAWRPSADQSDPASYSASDLMISRGSVTDGKLSFAMRHAMARVSVSFPSVRYIFENDPPIPDYVLQESSDIIFDSGIRPLACHNMEYVMIVNPSDAQMTSLAGSFSFDGTKRYWDIPVAGLQPGTANTYMVDRSHGRTISHHLSVGDLMLADGSLLPADAPAYEVAAAEVIGIIYTIDPARIGEAEKDMLGGNVHGAVMATRDVEDQFNTFSWSTVQLDESLIGLADIIGDSPAATVRMALNDLSGLQRLDILRSKRPDDYAADIYEAFSFTARHQPAAPQRTTGWYLPALGQWLDIVKNLGNVPVDPDMTFGQPDLFYWKELGAALSAINRSMAKVADKNKNEISANRYYWTSTAATDLYAYYINVTDGMLGVNSLSCFANPKTSWNYCRAVLVF